MASAVVTNIQGYSIHDGPGIRTVVFLKGCPMRCRWCANPENLIPDIQVGFIKNLCTGCGRCYKTCSRGAIRTGDCYRIDRSRCNECGECVDTCYYDALVRYGKVQTAAEVYDKVKRDKPFYDQSGGGVTISGGEPLIHPDFAFELFSLCREGGINTCVETCGCVPSESMARLMPLIDIFYFDLKIMDRERHREYTGLDNDLILANARMLAKSGAEILFRQPLIPGVNSGENNIAATAEFMKSLGERGMNIQLMPYHRMGMSKYEALDMPYLMKDTKIMSAEEVNAVMARYNELGVHCTVSR